MDNDDSFRDFDKNPIKDKDMLSGNFYLLFNEFNKIEPSQVLSYRDLENLNDSIILMFDNDDKKNDTIIKERTLPSVIKNVDNKFNLYNKENESVNSENNEKIINGDNIFDNFGFNQIKI